MARRFEDILDECLSRVLAGESIEQCLADHAELADRLEPLLRAASSTAAHFRVQPRPEFKAELRQQLLSKIPAPKPRRGWLPLLRWSPRWALALSFLLVLLLAGGSTVAASVNSLPDQPLYPVKLATERVQLAFAFSPVSQAKLEAKFADRRVAELSQMAQRGKLTKAEEVARRLAEHLEKMGQIAKAQALRKKVKDRDLAELKALLTSYAARHPAALQKALPRVPPKARPLILQALRMSAERYARAMRAVGEVPPGETTLEKWPIGKVRVVRGFIRSLTDTLWIVGGRVINITPETVIKGQPKVGCWARVEVEVQPDGSLKAKRIEVRARPWRPRDRKP